MIILLSPAKQMVFNRDADISIGFEPLFKEEASYLMSIITQMSIPEIEKVFKVSYPLACDTLKMAYNFESSSIKGIAVESFNGLAYKGIDANSFDELDKKFAQQHLRLGSGAYGVLRPYDIIKPYRLDLETELDLDKGKVKLQNFWKDKVTNSLLHDIQGDDGILLNLGSNETFQTIDLNKLNKSDITIINVRFLKNGPKGLVTMPIVYLKKLRGALTRFIIKNKCTRIEELYSFTSFGMIYDASLSDKTDIVFINEKI